MDWKRILGFTLIVPSASGDVIFDFSGSVYGIRKFSTRKVAVPIIATTNTTANVISLIDANFFMMLLFWFMVMVSVFPIKHARVVNP